MGRASKSAREAERKRKRKRKREREKKREEKETDRQTKREREKTSRTTSIDVMAQLVARPTRASFGLHLRAGQVRAEERRSVSNRCCCRPAAWPPGRRRRRRQWGPIVVCAGTASLDELEVRGAACAHYEIQFWHIVSAFQRLVISFRAISARASS